MSETTKHHAKIVWRGDRDDLRHRVLSYEDEPEGTLDGACFTDVVLRPHVVFEDDVSEDAIRLLHDQAHEACFIANSVNCAVEVESRLS